MQYLEVFIPTTGDHFCPDSSSSDLPEDRVTYIGMIRDVARIFVFWGRGG